MARAESKTYDFKMTIMILLFVFSIIGSVSSYLMSMSDIRQQIQTSMYLQAEKLREEMRTQYATKEELVNQKDLLREIKTDLKEIKGKIDTVKETVKN